MKHLGIRLASLARPVLLTIVGIVLVICLYIYKLGSLTTGVDASESHIIEQLRTNGAHITDLFRNAIDLPYSLGLYLIQFTPFDHAGAARILSVCFALLGIGGLFLTVRHWHTPRVATMGAALFAGSGWLLHIGRHGAPEVLYVMPLVVLGAYAWYAEHKRSAAAFTALAVAFAGCVYVPGLLPFIIILAIWHRRTILKALSTASAMQMTGLLLASALAIAPLVVSVLWRTDGQSALTYMQTLIGLPANWPSLQNYWHHFIDTPQQLFLMGGNTASWLTIANLPLLDVFTSAMVLVGAYVYGRDWRLDRSKALLGGTLIGWLLVALDGPVTISILLPFIYVFAAEGIRYMLSEWLTVFPRNPLARTASLTVLSAAVTVAIIFHVISYFSVWPHLSATKTQFSGQIISE